MTFVSTATDKCRRKQPWEAGRRALIGLAAGISLLGLAGCGKLIADKSLTLSDLKASPTVSMQRLGRSLVVNPEAIRKLCVPLGPRLALLEVRTAGQWHQLQHAACELGPQPNLKDGMVVGLVCWAGTPVDGGWPIRVNAVHIYGTAGLVEADFQGGNYLPDGVGYLEAVYVPGLRSVLVVAVNGTDFCMQ